MLRDNSSSVCTFKTSGGGKGAKGAFAPGGTLHGAAFGGVKYGILKFGRFWRVGVCITDSDIFTP